MPTWFDSILSHTAVSRLERIVGEGGAASARGANGSSTTLVAALLGQRAQRPILLVVAHLDEADDALDDLRALKIDAARVPAMEVAPGEANINPELLSERLTITQRLMAANPPSVLIAPFAALMQTVPGPDRIGDMLRTIRPGETLDSQDLSIWLDETGYTRVDAIESPGEFVIRGGIIDIFPPGGSPPVRIDLFGDEIEGLFEIDLDTLASDRQLDSVELIGSSVESLQQEEGMISLLELVSTETIAVLSELTEIVEQGRGYYERTTDARGVFGPPAVLKTIGERCGAMIDINQFSTGAVPERMSDLPVRALPMFDEDISTAMGELAELSKSHETIVLAENEGEAQRIHELVDEFAPEAAVTVQEHYLHRGFLWGEIEDSNRATPQVPKQIALVPGHELLHRYHVRRTVRRLGGGRDRDVFVGFEPGDFVVHRHHGVAKFTGLKRMADETGASEEFLTLEFSRNSKLHVPASKIELVQKYIGAGAARPKLSTIGGKRWKKQKEQVEVAVRDFAGQMLRIQAAREATSGVRYPADTAWQKEFEAEFPYEETEDQLTAINAAKRDMTDPQPMDRLVCGDVGFGKTEVAMRAAFKSAEYGKQVAVLVPTTVLAEQHEQTFRARFGGYPFRIESLSRFKTKKDQRALLGELRRGGVDIIIGTHRLLSKDVHFADLGLVIVDEEQRFGVEHKQRLLELRLTADVMTLSATPIPRTLHMSMLGLRDISSLTQPPLDRRAIVTEVIPYNKQRIKQALQRELAREGQVFFVHNRVHNIETVADEVSQLVPDARIVVGHGQMPARELEKVMLKFIRRQADIIVCTTIIESGIDIPTANTMFINNAHMFGLADLHQLRGRVGRYKHRAYCYMLLPQDKTVNEQAVKRMRAIEEYSMLGAGFKIAMRDLELRGAGNLLGAEQSGHIAAVGYEMYCQLLDQAVTELREGRAVVSIETTVDIGLTGSIPKGYIPSDLRRMEAYRRISQANSKEVLEKVDHDLHSAYSEPPTATQVLLELAELRIAAASIGVRSIRRHEKDVIFKTDRPGELEETMAGAQGRIRVIGQPDSTGLAEVYYRPPKPFLEPRTLLTVLRRRLSGEQRALSAVAHL